MAMSKKSEEFAARTMKLSSFNVEGHTFCCVKHQKAFFDIQEQAEKFVSSLTNPEIKASFSQAQLDFARAIVMGKASHASSGSDPERQVTAKCVQRIEGSYTDSEGVEHEAMVPCGATITGTAKQVGEWKTKCEEHRS